MPGSAFFSQIFFFLHTEIFFSEQTAFPAAEEEIPKICPAAVYSEPCFSCIRNPVWAGIRRFLRWKLSAKASFRKSGIMIFSDFTGISRHCFTWNIPPAVWFPFLSRQSFSESLFPIKISCQAVCTRQGTSFFILNLRFFLRSFPEFPYR